MGSVYLRGKSYVGKYKDASGTWRERTLGRKDVITKTIAREALREIERKIKLCKHYEQKTNIPNLKMFGKDYLNYITKVVQKRSWKRDELCLRNLNSFFGTRKLSSIKPQDIDDYKSYRLNTVKASTVNRELEVLRHIFNLAERWDKFFGQNPVSKSGLLKVNNRIERILSYEEESELLDASPACLRNIIFCALNTGMRKGEIISLKWNNVALNNNIITVHQTNSKSKKQRKVPINSALRKLLLELKIQNLHAEHVFLNTRGFPYKRQDSMNKIFQSALKKANIKGLRFHDLRHTAATRMVENTGNIVAVKEILGHSSIDMTMRYAHPSESLKDAVESLCLEPNEHDNSRFGLHTKNAGRNPV